MTKKVSNKKRIVLLDTHAIIHRAYHALPEFTGPTGAPTGALYGLVAMLLKIIADLKPDYIAACYDLPKPTIRHEAYADYKESLLNLFNDDKIMVRPLWNLQHTALMYQNAPRMMLPVASNLYQRLIKLPSSSQLIKKVEKSQLLNMI